MALPAAVITGAASALLGGLGGGGARRQVAKYQNAAMDSLGNLSGVRDDLYGIGQDAQGALNTFNPQARRATQDYANTLLADPWTDDYESSVLSEMLAGVGQDHAAKRAQAAADLARRGISGSNVAAGSVVGNYNSEAAVQAAARNAIARERVAGRLARQKERAGVLTGAADRELQTLVSALLRAGVIDENTAHTYLNMAGQAQARADQRQAGVLGTVGSVANVLAGLGKSPNL